jgi:hypothetical protein
LDFTPSPIYIPNTLKKQRDGIFVFKYGFAAGLARRSRHPVRGDRMWKGKCRTYGLSWGTDRAIAEERFAKGIWRTFQGGRVLLTTVTPPEAIICAPG